MPASDHTKAVNGIHRSVSQPALWSGTLEMTVDYVGVITAAADAAIDNPVRHRRTRLLRRSAKHDAPSLTSAPVAPAQYGHQSGGQSRLTWPKEPQGCPNAAMYLAELRM
jgi:hypothetical protein